MFSVNGSDQLRAVVLAVKGARREIRNDLNKSARTVMNEPWRTEVTSRAKTKLDRAVIPKGARIVAGNPPVAVAATATRKMRGGLVPATQWHAVEFGADHSRKTTYTGRTPAGGTYKVTRHTTRQLPARARRGRIAHAAFADIAPRLVSLWIQTVVRTFAEALEKGGKS